MDIRGYRERKKEKKVEFRKTGEKSLVIFAQNYEPTTGKRLDDTFTAVNVGGLENDLKNLDAQILQAQEDRADLVALIEDAKKELEKK